MSRKIVPVEEAETRLLELIDLAEQGEDIVIAHDDQPKVKLVPLSPVGKKRVFGKNRGKIRMSADFDEPLPDDFWLSGTP